jgi:hypothetical protein
MPARMPRTCGTPRRRTVSCVAPRSVGRRRPVAHPSVRRTLGGSRFAYKGVAALATARQAPTTARWLASFPPSRPSPGTRSRGGHHRRPTVCPPLRRLLSPTEPQIQTLVGPRPLPYPPPAGIRRSPAGIAAEPPLPAPRITLQRRNSFRGPACKLVTEIVKCLC